MTSPAFREEADTATVLGFSVPRRLSPEDDRRIETAALLPAPWERRVIVTGRDAARFLHNMLTQDVTGMAISSVRPTALADRKGHAIAEGWLWRSEESRFVLRIAEPYVSVVLDLLDRHRIMEKVEWTVPPVGSPFLLVGPQAGAVLGVGDAGPGSQAGAIVDVGEARADSRAGAALGAGDAGAQTGSAPGVEEGGQLPAFGDDACWMRVKEITPNDRVVFASIPPATTSAWLTGALPVGWDAFDRARIEAGRAWMGLDVDSERLVPEPGWEDHISYSKGCYLGQETLARLHYQGRLNWRLSRLSWSGPPVPSGTELVSEDKTEGGSRLGWITSIQPSGGGCRALGFLHRRVEEGSIGLYLPDGRPVIPLPIPRGSI